MTIQSALATAAILSSASQALAFGMPLCRDAAGLFAAKAEDGWSIQLLGTSDGGRATYISVAADGRFEIIAEPIPGLACLILSGIRQSAEPPDPAPPMPEQRDG
jgi:hypothetical protein